MNVISRQEAKDLGLAYYFSGKPCPKGHVDQRLVSDYGCRECKRMAVKKWAKENPERAAIKARESVLRNWGKYIARHKEWRGKNREKVRQVVKNYTENNKEKVKAMIKAWGKENPERVRAARLNRIAREKNADGFFTSKDVLGIFAMQDGMCASCGCVLENYHVDHIMPLALGGSNYPDNLQILCVKCNCSKGAKHPDDWKEYLQKQNMRVNFALVENA